MKICFVCTGNTCRSPMLEFMFKKYLAEKGEDIVVVSAGTMMHEKPMSQYTKNALITNGVPFEDRLSVFASGSLIDGCDVVYTMTNAQADMLREISNNKNITPLSEICGGDIADPYGLGQEAYDRVFNQFTAIIPLILKDVKKRAKKPDKPVSEKSNSSKSAAEKSQKSAPDKHPLSKKKK